MILPAAMILNSVRRNGVSCRAFLYAILFFSIAQTAWADSGTSYANFLNALAARESGLNPTITNSAGYVGLFQFGEAALTSAGFYKADGTPANDWSGQFTGKDGVTSLAVFKNNPDMQIQAVASFEAVQWKTIQNLGLDKYLGQTISGVTITESGMLAGAHLVGVGGLQTYLQSGGTKIPVDGNNTPISQYIQKFGGYTIGGQTPTYAQVLAATNREGLASSPVQGTNAGFTNGSSSSNTGVGYTTGSANSSDPDTAFYQASGYHYSDVSEAIKLITASLLVLWLAQIVLQSWTVYMAGVVTSRQFEKNIVHGTLIVLILIELLT